MNSGASFSTSMIPSVDDRESLAAWSRGDDPLKVVLPLSIAAAWAYSDQGAFDKVMKRRGLRSGPSKFVEVINDAMFVCAKAYLQPVGAGAIVAFCGTDPMNIINWLADATLEPAAFHAKPPGAPRGYVHGGFYRNIRAVWPEVVEALDGLRPEWFYIVGHSFGGALAALAAALLADYATEKPAGYGALWPKLKGVFTFGQPMVGDEQFAASYRDSVGARLFRFVYAHDVVPHMPPESRWLPKPFGAEYRAPDGAKWLRESTSSQPLTNVLGGNLIAIAAWIKEQTPLAPKLTLPYSWRDHAPNNYVRVSLPWGADSGSEFD